MKIEKTVDRGSKEKLYVQIYSIILDKIESGFWPSGTQIPPEDELCRIYDVSKATVREAVQELVREGYLTRQQGRGTFVAYSFPHLGIVMRSRLSEDIFGEEVKVRREIIETGFRIATDEIKRILITADEDIYYILNKKIVVEEAFKEEIFLPPFILPGLEKEVIHEKSIYDLIEEKGTKKIFRVVQTTEITKLHADNAAFLKVAEETSALLVSRILFSSDGSPIAYTKLVGGLGKNKIHMEFERIK